MSAKLYSHNITIIGEEKHPSCTLFFYGADKPKEKISKLITERLLPGSACIGFQVFFYFVAMDYSTHPQPLLQSLQLRPIWFPSFAQAHTARLHIVFFSSFACLPFSPSLIEHTLYGYISQQQQKSFCNQYQQKYANASFCHCKRSFKCIVDFLTLLI